MLISAKVPKKLNIVEYCMLRRKKGPMSITIIISATIFISTMVLLTMFKTMASAQGQGIPTLTPEQKAAMCNPNNPKLKVVNGTESKICGIPKTIKNTTATGNMITGSEANPPPPPPSSMTSAAPSIIPFTLGNTITTTTATAANTTTKKTELAAAKECASEGFSFLYCQYLHGLKH